MCCTVIKISLIILILIDLYTCMYIYIQPLLLGILLQWQEWHPVRQGTFRVVDIMSTWFTMQRPDSFLHELALSQVRICRHERWAQCWIEWKIIFKIFPTFIFLIVFTIYQKIYWPKKSCSKGAKFTGKVRIALKMIF